MQTLEQRVALLERTMRHLEEGVSAAHHGLLDATRESHALSRLLMSVTALAARDAADPLKFMDEVRTMALGPLVHDELADTRERIEIVLSKVEGALNKR